jgi:DNA repair exonuclease SbcCD nuclease subunit
MIKKIIHTGDIHIRNFKRLDEYREQLQKFIDKCKEIVSQYNPEEVRIVIAGDLVHSKTELSPECYTLASWFLRQLDKICKTIVIAGNHDVSPNLSRLDPLSVIFSMSKFKQVYYLDKDLGYQSGIVEDDNVVWCLYSAFDDFRQPCILDVRDYHCRAGISDEHVRYIALFHGDLKSAKTDVGYVSESGLEANYFDAVDFGLFGHIHKRQCIKADGIPLVYCGSLIQQDFSENLSCHGFLSWDVEEETYEEIDIPNEDYGYYTFSINELNDLDDDKEELINL